MTESSRWFVTANLMGLASALSVAKDRPATAVFCGFVAAACLAQTIVAEVVGRIQGPPAK